MNLPEVPEEKLIRDNMVEWSRNNPGGFPIDHRVRFVKNEKERVGFLLLKLKEEMEEVKEAFLLKSDSEFMEELADIYEVLGSLREARNLQSFKVWVLINKKREERGSFKTGLILRGPFSWERQDNENKRTQ